MLNDIMPTWYSRDEKETSRRIGNNVLSVILKSYHLWYGKSIMKKLRSLYVTKTIWHPNLRVAVPSLQGETEARERLRKPDTD